jgi:O-antigen biosynthesis protein
MAISDQINPRDVPIRVVELELSGRPTARPGAARTREPGWITGHVLGLVRLHGHPIGLVRTHIDDDADDDAAISRLTSVARGELADAITERAHLAPSRGPADLPMISVVIPTRERPDELARCLASLERVDYPRFEVIVVDNDPVTNATERMVRDRFADTVTYVREPLRGCSVARNRGIAAASGDIIAFTDDDVVVDPAWLAAIADGFASGDRVGCVTGLIVPAELETPAQAMLERYGSYMKGFTPYRYDLRRPCGDALFPFTVFRVGSGASMAFTASALRQVRGFDLATGSDRLVRTGEDLVIFFRTLAAGYGVVYRPDALVWHHHRRTVGALAPQAFRYGIGFGAYLTAAIVHEPRMLPALLLRLPRGIARKLRRSRFAPDGATAWPHRFSALEWIGYACGPIAYARSRWHVRHIPVPFEHGAAPCRVTR